MNSNDNTLLPVPGPGEIPETLPALPGLSAAPQQEPIKKVLSVMRGRWHWVAIFSISLGLVGAVAGYMVGRKILKYASVGTIHVISKPELLLGGKSVPEGEALLNYDSYMQTQVNLILSNRILQNATHRPEFKGIDTSDYASDLEFVKKGLEVKRVLMSELIGVTFSHPNREVAQRVAKAVIDSYMELEGERETKAMKAKREDLDRLRLRYESDLTQALNRRAEKIREFQTPDLKVLAQKKLEEFTALRTELDRMRRQMATAGINIDDLDKPRDPAADAQAEKPGDGSPESDPSFLTPEAVAEHDSVMKRLLTDRDQYAKERDRHMATLGANHRDVKRDSELVTAIERRIEERLAEVSGTGPGALPLAADAAQSPEQLKRRYSQVRADYERIQKESERLVSAISDLSDIEHQETDARAHLDEARERIRRLEAEADRIRRVEVANIPDVPDSPDPDRRKLLAAAGLLFGAGLGFGLVLFTGLLDRRLRNIHDAEEAFADAPMLGILPTLPDNLADPQQAALAAHCVHQIRTLLQIGPESHGRRVFVITSPSPQSGKTSLALALGLSYAATGAKTLLIDCDMGFAGLTHRMNTIIRRKIGQVLLRERLITAHQLEQAVHLARESDRRIGETLVDLGYLKEEDLDRALDLQEHGTVGLMDVIDGEPLESCVSETGNSGLFILPSGAAEPHQVARLSPSTLRRLLDQARALFDVVLVDTGSVLGSIEASHVAVESDGVVVVLSRGEDKSRAAQALGHLRSIGARVAGLVFNRAIGHDVQVVAERSTGSMISRPHENGHRPPGADVQRPRMGPVAGAVASSSNRALRR